MQLTSRELVAATLARDATHLPVERIAYVAKRLHATACVVRDLSALDEQDPSLRALNEQAITNASRRATNVLSAHKIEGWAFQAGARPKLVKGSVEIVLH